MPVETFYRCIYRPADKVPIGLVDIFFTKPENAQGGIYPIIDLDDKEKTRIKYRPYQINFEARSTTWQYFIVPPEGSRVGDLKLFNENNEEIEIAPPKPENVGGNPNALSTHLLTKRALSSIPSELYSLTGILEKQNGFTMGEKTLVSLMPTAPVQQVSVLETNLINQNQTGEEEEETTKLEQSSRIYVYL